MRLPFGHLGRVLLAALVGWVTPPARSQPAEPAPRKDWACEWISHPTASLRDPAVFHFRKVITLASAPARFVVQVSADNRFVLFANGKRIGEGPARGDLGHWRYETFDLAPDLRAGENVIAAVVWNWGLYAPLAQVTDRTAFLMEGDTPAEAGVNTDASWQVELDRGFTFVPRVADGFWFYWAADTPESLDGAAHDWGWRSAGNSPGSDWVAASDAIREVIYPKAGKPESRAFGFRFAHWGLVPDPLPQMVHEPTAAGTVVRTDLDGGRDFPVRPVVVPAHRQVALLLDRGTMTSGYPELTVSGGRGARVRLGYTEALYDAKQRRGDRGEVGDRQVLGQWDEFIPDGGAGRTFSPLWFRTWRFLEIRVATGEEPLRLDGLEAYFRAYPFEERAAFSSDDPDLGRLWEICWRGARLDAHETYMDTPYWEQLQYIFDTRIQAVISYTVAGDDRLARQALRAFSDSQLPEGVTQSRYPSSLIQVIPTFSLEYVAMLHDYWMYRPDPALVRELLPGTRRVMDWFRGQLRPDGFLKELQFGDGTDTPIGGSFSKFPPLDREGRSSITTLLFVLALDDAAQMERALGDPCVAERYEALAKKSAVAVYAACWSADRGLLADTPDRDSYSQHANLEAVLVDAIPRRDQAAVMGRLIDAQTRPRANGVKLAIVSYPYQFLLARAVDKAGLGDRYLSLLGSWRRMLAMGFTTVPEGPDPSRSDTHAWSAHPIYDLLTTVAGIHPDAPGFARVKLTPHLGPLHRVDARMPHPLGIIHVRYEREGDVVVAEVDLPDHLGGALEWAGREFPLSGGRQSFRLKVPAAPQ